MRTSGMWYQHQKGNISNNLSNQAGSGTEFFLTTEKIEIVEHHNTTTR